jgi:hypothetical protein
MWLAASLRVMICGHRTVPSVRLLMATALLVELGLEAFGQPAGKLPRGHGTPAAPPPHAAVLSWTAGMFLADPAEVFALRAAQEQIPLLKLMTSFQSTRVSTQPTVRPRSEPGRSISPIRKVGKLACHCGDW